MNGMTNSEPYYDKKGVTIYHGDCLEVMRRFEDESFGLVLTDPPYGIDLKYDIYEDTESNWYDLMDKVLPEIIRLSKMTILPSCKINRLPWIYKNYPPDWLICWYKGSTGHASYIGFNDWEPHLVYGRIRDRLYMHDYFQTKSSPKKGGFNHPCPKPIEWANWLIKRATKDTDTILDPFIGSGTTLVAAKALGRKAVGIDISEKYCELTVERLRKQKKVFFN